MTTPVRNALRTAAAMMRANSALALVPAIEAAATQCQCTALDVSYALNVFLRFPRGTWWEWETTHGRTYIARVLIAAANKKDPAP